MMFTTRLRPLGFAVARPASPYRLRRGTPAPLHKLRAPAVAQQAMAGGQRKFWHGLRGLHGSEQKNKLFEIAMVMRSTKANEQAQCLRLAAP